MIDGFKYDIFISYRQKDNRGDRWVTEFVNALKSELDATFKEDISIYFDENPHDGLLETHDVDESLKEKLKCLIFIPIISQTYCDPKSFAWNSELLPFKKLASEDELGLKVKLQNGNVASRILPVRIHELDENDKATLEHEIGQLRAVDFIFKAPGVNRPLTPSDLRNENSNKTVYKDQVNKVANAVKEIKNSLNQPAVESSKPKSLPLVETFSLKKIVIASTLAIALIAIGFYYVKQILPEKSIRDGVAIIPFKNSTGKADLDYYGLGIASEIRTRLSMSKQFKFVSSMQATLPYADAQKSTSQIGDELSVDFILSGLYQMSGSKIKVVAELVDAKNGQSLWSLPIECEMQDIFQVESKIADKVLRQFNGHITELEKVSTTSNLAAYAHYMRGNRLLEGNSNDSSTVAVSYGPIILQYEKAIELDSGFIDAWTDLIGVESFVYAAERKDSIRKTRIKKYYAYFNKHFPGSWQKKLVQAHYAYRIERNSSKALPLFLGVLDENPENVHATYGASSIFTHQLDFENALKYAVKYVNLTPGYGSAWFSLGWILDMTGDTKNSYNASLKAWSLSHSKNHGATAIFRSVKAGSFNQLPEELKKEQRKTYDTWQNMLARNWVELKKRMIKKKDWESVMYACDRLGEVDSAIWYFKKEKRERTSFDSVFFYRLTKNRSKAFDALTRHWSAISNPDDKLNLITQRLTEVNLHIDLGEYKEATEKLTAINRDYPAFGDFSDYNFIPDYDKIKKEYPPFQAALNNLKLKQPVDIRQFIDL